MNKASKEFCQAIQDELGIDISIDDSGMICSPDFGMVGFDVNKFSAYVGHINNPLGGVIEVWWQSCLVQGVANGLIPLLAYKPDSSYWRIVLPINHISPGLSDEYPPIEWTVTFTVQSFCAYLRENVEAF